MIKYYLIIYCILSSLLITPVNAQPIQGQELYNYFEEYLKFQNEYNGNEIKAGMFLGYVRGILDALEGTAFCIPNNIPISQLIPQVVKYLYEHSRSQSLAARNLILESLRGQFKCRD